MDNKFIRFYVIDFPNSDQLSEIKVDRDWIEEVIDFQDSLNSINPPSGFLNEYLFKGKITSIWDIENYSNEIQDIFGDSSFISNLNVGNIKFPCLDSGYVMGYSPITLDISSGDISLSVINEFNEHYSSPFVSINSFRKSILKDDIKEDKVISFKFVDDIARDLIGNIKITEPIRGYLRNITRIKKEGNKPLTGNNLAIFDRYYLTYDKSVDKKELVRDHNGNLPIISGCEIMPSNDGKRVFSVFKIYDCVNDESEFEIIDIASDSVEIDKIL